MCILKTKNKEQNHESEYTHKPNYFLFAQLLIRHIENMFKTPDADNAIFDLRDIYELFRQDKASTTTNLEGILNIVDEYKIETINGDQKIISRYKIDAENNFID
jgi:acyl-CoA-binding protein